MLSALWDDQNPDYDSATRAEMLLRTIESVKAAGVHRIVVLGSAPEWTAPVPLLLIRDIHGNPYNPVPHRLARSLLEAHDDILLRATTLRAGAVYVPIFESLCDQTSCIATTGPGWKDVVTYDQAHFTEHGSILVTQLIWSAIIGSKR